MTKKQIIETGRAVLRLEGKAVSDLSQSLGDEFARAVELLCRTKTRVIVLGMGKSGLVGRKLAATLASCGTPAIFIHPAEAAHGDLGMILKEDVVIAISYSGETREIVDLLDFFKRIGVKLIAITGNRSSKIARYSDIVLDAAVPREAGPGNIVPTASSTAALALGDALAIAAMTKKGFSERDFAFVHPKGAGGAQAPPGRERDAPRREGPLRRRVDADARRPHRDEREEAGNDLRRRRGRPARRRHHRRRPPAPDGAVPRRAVPEDRRAIA